MRRFGQRDPPAAISDDNHVVGLTHSVDFVKRNTRARQGHACFSMNALLALPHTALRLCALRVFAFNPTAFARTPVSDVDLFQ
jgi:hypothetical protein